MEANSILNAFVVAASQYTASQTEQNLLHLQRHLDVVMGLSASSSDLHFFDPRQIVITEFVTSLINILLEAEPKLGLVQRVLSVLQNLVKIQTIKDSLQSTFYVHSALSIFLQNFGVSVKDPLVMQCLQLLEIFTCGINISYIESHLENLIHVLIKQIDNKSPEVLLPALHILSNLCRHNFQIQSYIRNMPNMKQVYKALVSKLCSPIPTVVVYTLSTLASLSFNNDMGEKLFTAKHTVKTFELIVNMLVASDQKAKYAALDLLMDLMEFSKLQTHFIRYQHLNLILQKVVDTCSKESSSEQSLMYLKFLLTFMKIPETKIHVSSVLCSKRGNDESDNFSGDEIHQFLIHWALQTVDTAGDTPVIALQLLKSIIESYPDDKIEQIEPCLRQMLPALSSMMTEYVNFDSLLLKKQLQRQVAGFSLLYAICQKPNFQNNVSKHLNIKNCEQIVKTQLENNSLSCKENEWSEVGVDLLLLAIGVVAVIKDSLSGADEFLNTVLQETRLMPFLAYALCSTCPDRVNKALFVLFLSSDLPMFPYQMLGENIAATNINHYQRKSVLSEIDQTNFDAKPPLSSFEYSTLKSVAMHNRRNSVDRNVQTLIHKIENGLDLRDLKSSEIMDMYEHKIAALCLKEQELQDLVQAKSTALQQADRILSQYKCRQAQRDAEALRLRSLLKESERRSEAAREQANQAVQQQLKLHRELEAAHQEINCLEQQNEEQKENMGEQLQRLAALQKTLENLQVEYNSISEMHAMLQRHSETMKQKQDLMTQQSLQLEEDKKNLTRQLKEKDTKIKEVNKQLQKAEELFKKKEKEYEDLKTSKEALEKAADKTEKSKCKLEQEVSSLELVCKQYEASLEEKDAEIKSLLGQLDKHKHITEMIHEITSGRTSVASLLDK